MRSIDINDRAIKEAFKSYKHSLSRTKKNFFYKRGNSNDPKVIMPKYEKHFNKYNTRQNSPGSKNQFREDIHGNSKNHQVFYKVNQNFQAPRRRIETGKIDFVLGRKNSKRTLPERKIPNDSTYWNTPHTKSLTREKFTRRNSPKESWNTPLSQKIDMKFSTVDNILKNGGTSQKVIESTKAHRTKRFNATHHFEKRRNDRIISEERKEAIPVAAVPEIKPFKGAVINPTKIIKDFYEKENTNVVEVFEKSRTGFIPIGPETGFQGKTNQDAYMTIESFCGVPGQYFLSVFDGHGYNGHRVSKYIKKRLPRNIKSKASEKPISYLEKIVKTKDDDNQIIQTFNSRRSSMPSNDEEMHDSRNIFDLIGKEGVRKRKIIQQSFYQTHADLK